MPALDFFNYLAAIQKERRNDFQEKLKVSAFTGWQFKSVIGAMFGTKVESFPEYSEAMGLLNVEEKAQLKIYKEIQKLQNKAAAKKNMEDAANIVQLDRAAKKRKGE